MKYIIAYPISHGKMINFVAFKSQYDLEHTKFNGPWVGPADNTEFLALFKHWEPEVQALLDVSLGAKMLSP
jgi:salicylate hydroxylase